MPVPEVQRHPAPAVHAGRRSPGRRAHLDEAGQVMDTFGLAVLEYDDEVASGPGVTANCGGADTINEDEVEG